MEETIFVFGSKEEINSSKDNLIFIDNDGDYSSLENYLKYAKNMDEFLFCKPHIQLDYFSDSDIFVSYKDKFPIEVRLKENLIPRNCIVSTTENLDLDTVLENIEKDYDIFSGDKLPKNKEVEIVMRDMINIMYQFLEAGYLEKLNKKRIDDWIIPFQYPVLDLFIRYHQFETSALDNDISMEFIINPAFRRNILVVMMRIISNLIINNKIITKKEVSEYGSWLNKDLWISIKPKLIKY